MPFTMDITESKNGRRFAAAVGVGAADARANENSISLRNVGEYRCAVRTTGKSATDKKLNNRIMRKTYPDTGVGRA